MKVSKGQKIFNVINVMIILFLCVIMVYPYLNQLAISLNESLDTSVGGVTIFPRKPTLDNFRKVIMNEQIYGGAIMSVSRTVIGTILALLLLMRRLLHSVISSLKAENFSIGF